MVNVVKSKNIRWASQTISDSITQLRIPLTNLIFFSPSSAHLLQLQRPRSPFPQSEEAVFGTKNPYVNTIE